MLGFLYDNWTNGVGTIIEIYNSFHFKHVEGSKFFYRKIILSLNKINKSFFSRMS